MILLVLYIIGVLIHLDGFGVIDDVDPNILDYEPMMQSLYVFFSLIWPLFWLVMVIYAIKELFRK